MQGVSINFLFPTKLINFVHCLSLKQEENYIYYLFEFQVINDFK